MGKPTGFLEYERCDIRSAAPEERINNFDEFHYPSDDEERKRQGARCMNCGIPFCQSPLKDSGCPLQNLIPEWNDQIYHGNIRQAYDRLRKTNNFPEFTARVCPALCEVSCTCGLYGDSVTIRDNELHVIEKAFEEGLVSPHIPEVRTDKKIAVIGSGPAGLACADRLNQRGHSVTIFEKDDRPGGLLMYGIPNMKLDKGIVKRRTDLLEAEGIEFVTGKDCSVKKTAEKIISSYDAVVLCTGAGKPRDMDLPGRDSSGVYFASDYLTAATKAVLDGKKPIDAKDRNVTVIGGGDTAEDCVATALRQGCRSVTQLIRKPEKKHAVTYAEEESIAVFGKNPKKYMHTVTEIIADEDGNICQIRVKNGEDDSESLLDCDMLLLATGFTGTDDRIFRAFGVKPSESGNISASEEDFATDKEKVFAAGDSRRGASLVVWAIREGRMAARAVDRYLMGYTNMNY